MTRNQNPNERFTLYVDGACRGNPGRGGWGALIIAADSTRHELYGGEAHTTNNRMELTAALQGILACPPIAHLTIYTDSSYVKDGITKWIHGWKAKKWLNVKNPDLWQQLDAACQNRNIDWHWIKGHAGHEGNEHADRLANLGADGLKQTIPIPLSTRSTEDELMNRAHSEQNLIPQLSKQTSELLSDFSSDLSSKQSSKQLSEHSTAHKNPADLYNSTASTALRITPTTLPQNGKRYLILDTETTGFYHHIDDRMVELGAIELINRKLTGSSLHVYFNPNKDVGESENIHGLSNQFLADKPLFEQVAAQIYDYLKGAHIIAHNASFDMSFLDSEFERAGFGKLSDVVEVTDTLALAKRKHPGQKNSLDALVKRYEIPERDRTFHGALLDAEILNDVYLAMTGGQVSLEIEQDSHQLQSHINPINRQVQATPLIVPSEAERTAHQQWLDQYEAKYEQDALFRLVNA